MKHALSYFEWAELATRRYWWMSYSVGTSPNTSYVIMFTVA